MGHSTALEHERRSHGKERTGPLGEPPWAELGSGVLSPRGRFWFDIRKCFQIFRLHTNVWASARGPAFRERRRLILTRVSGVDFWVGTSQIQGSLGLF